jgi:hypothetical protein
MNKNNILFWLGMLLAVWFAITGIVWVYWAAVVIAYPAGLISLWIYFNIRRENKKRAKILIITLGIGLALSLGVLLALVIFK